MEKVHADGPRHGAQGRNACNTGINMSSSFYDTQTGSVAEECYCTPADAVEQPIRSVCAEDCDGDPAEEVESLDECPAYVRQVCKVAQREQRFAQPRLENPN